MTTVIILLVLSYLFGSFPTGYVLGKIYKGIDIRQFGSGNIGMTNAWRVLGRKAGLLTLVVDLAKGPAAVILASVISGDMLTETICGGMAILGHNFPVWLKFKGGKGVATTLGVFLTLSPLPTVVCFLLLVVGTGLTRYMSVGSLLFASSLPVVILIFGKGAHLVIFALVAGGLIFFRHKSNIKRLLAGKENKLSLSVTGLKK